MAKLLISITNAKNDTDRATVGCVVANASVASGVETVIFLSTEGVRLSQEGYADDIHEEGFAPLKKLLTDFVDAGGFRSYYRADYLIGTGENSVQIQSRRKEES